ncbi:ATP-binding protein [Aggregatilineales bacterium SYSU G02658]
MFKLPAATAALDGLRHAALLFSSEGALVYANIAAGVLLSTDLHLLRKEGWSAALALFSMDEQQGDYSLNQIREQALSSDRPVTFYIIRSGEYIPCSASAVAADNGELHMLLVIDNVEWGIVSTVLDQFTNELNEIINATNGHITLINRTLEGPHADAAAAKLARRIGGFGVLIAMHMRRASRLMNLMRRLENLRTGKTRRRITSEPQVFSLKTFIEEFIQSLDEHELLDPETDNHNYRGRIQVDIREDLTLLAHKSTLADALHELLRNAIMYSMRGTPVLITVHRRGSQAQIDIRDEGYGIREEDQDCVFQLFERGKNPQIMSEFGYGLALYLVKHEIALMNGKVWFQSVENVATTFSILLPLSASSAANNPA